MVDTISPECQRNQPNGDMGELEGLVPEVQAELVEGSITKEEQRRAELVEALLRYNLVREAQDTKAELSEKVKRLIETNKISAETKSKDDFRAVFERLTEYHGEGSAFDLDEDALDEMYEAMMSGEDHHEDDEDDDHDDEEEE